MTQYDDPAAGLTEADDRLAAVGNSDISNDCLTCPLRDTTLVFDPQGRSIDAEVPENQQATSLTFPPIPGSARVSVDGMVDAFHRRYGDEALAQLFAVVGSDASDGSLGYRIEISPHRVYDYSIDHDTKVISVDNEELFSDFTNDEAAAAIHEALQDIATHIAYQNESFWQTVGRIALGSGLVVLGAAETVVGVVGIIVPEPGTTAAGVAVTALGAATVGEGATMVFGLNDGRGYNFLAEGFGAIGSLTGGTTGEGMAKTAFSVVNLVVSVGGTVRILKVPNQAFVMRGHLHGVGSSAHLANAVGDGFTVGRLQLMYRLPSGRVYVNITNNSNQWLIRLQQIEGQVVINGRIIGVEKWHRLSNPAEVMKMMVKLVLHGFR